jgi:N utilization substance protein A
MRGSRIQAIVRELNNEKIDIVNFSEQNEILLTRALSPAKPLQLYIDDEKRYCVALFEDDSLDAAIGRNGMNVNLASKITEYKIDAYGVQQYERIQDDQKTPISDIEGVDNKFAKILEESGISLVSDLLDSDMDSLLNLNGIDEQALDSIYESVQNYVERKIEPEKEEDEIDLSSLGIELEDNRDSGPDLEKSISEEE